MLVRFLSVKLPALDLRPDCLTVLYVVTIQLLIVIDLVLKMLVLDAQINVSTQKNQWKCYSKLYHAAALVERITVIQDTTSVRLTWTPIVNHTVIRFDLDCFSVVKNTNHVARSSVLGDNTSAELSGLTPSTSYNCCVSAVLERYTSTTCTSVNTLAVFSSAQTGIHVELVVLSFLCALFLMLFTLTTIALVFLVCINYKKNRCVQFVVQ